MTDLQELYQEVILDHNKRPRNFGRLEGATHRAEGFNPLCGDRITVFLDIEAGKVKEVYFQGNGCAISTASASVMTEMVKGRTLEETRELFDKFHNLVTREDGETEDLGKLVVFAGVRAFPIRVKCATLAWHTLQAALKGDQTSVTTE
ncbi:MAG: SUF system NifU family Fe-S cluster assembly protein [Acidobacteria bacterium]|nr:SUF system NifU family Fe-S cluster assembly protein [Acidobacteriota bacterium]